MAKAACTCFSILISNQSSGITITKLYFLIYFRNNKIILFIRNIFHHSEWPLNSFKQSKENEHSSWCPLLVLLFFPWEHIVNINVLFLWCRWNIMTDSFRTCPLSSQKSNVSECSYKT